MPYPSPVTYPSPLLYPDFTSGGDCELMVAIGDLVLGATDEFGVRWSIPTFEGWDGSPGTTLELTQRGRAPGATGNEPFLNPRFMRAEGFIHAPTHEAQQLAFARLNAAVTLDQFQMLVAHQARALNCAAQRQGEVICTPLTDKLAKYSILIVAKDPLKYGDLVSRSTRLPATTGGLVFPATFPVTFTGSSNTGVVRINNPGNTQAPVWLRAEGPIPAGGWAVTHIGKRQSLAFAPALDLDAGEFLTVDMENREVLAQGQSPRSGYVASRGWFSLDPGINEIAFTAQNYSATAQLTILTKSAWS